MFSRTFTDVVFEDLYHNGVKITSHADLTDKEESINYPEKPKTPDTPQTGDKTNLIGFGAVLAASAAAATALIRRRKKINAQEESEE